MAFITLLREKLRPSHVHIHWEFGFFLIVPFLLAAKSITPTPFPAGPMIIITPNQGSPSAFELVRVDPDKVEVQKEGVRLQFARHQIKQIRVPEAGDLVLEAVGVLSRMETEDLSAFESILPQLESKIPPLSNLANRFGWLIPDASPTLGALKQSVADIRATLRVTSNLQETGKRIEAMANGNIPLSATWEEQINLALADTNSIPYMKIRKETLDRFLAIRRKIRLDLTQANQEATARARNLLEDLHSELQAGTLTEAGAQLLIKETRRYVERILEPSERAKLETQLAKAVETSHNWFSERAVRESAQEVQILLVKVQSEISTSSPSVNLVSVLPKVFQLRRLVAEVPESTTQESLALQLAALEKNLRDLPPPGNSENQVAAQSEMAQPSDPELESRNTVIPVGQVDPIVAILRGALTDWRLWAGVSLIFLILNFRLRKALPSVHVKSVSHPGQNHESSRSGGPHRKTLADQDPTFAGSDPERQNTSWSEIGEDPLLDSRGLRDEVELDAYGRIKKKRNTQG